MSLTEENLIQHHLEMSYLQENPAESEQKQMQRAAQIKAALKSLDAASDSPLPDYLADKVISGNFEWMLPIEQYVRNSAIRTTSTAAPKPSSSMQGCSKSVASK
jgi:hypothetical protein